MYRHILKAVFNQPLAILPEKLEEVRAFLRSKTKGEDIPPDQVQAIVVNRPALPAIAGAVRRADGVVMAGRVAVLPVFGVISQRVGMLERGSGGVSTEEIGATLDGLVADRQVRAIVMAFDSPGGSVYGVEELGRKILSARGEKKIFGLADSIAASAAYWLLSQTSEINVTPGGQVGSIGVIAAHVDVSKMEESLGVKTTLVSSAQYKAEFAPETPLGEEARAELQNKVNHYHGLFVAAVGRGRGVTEVKVEKSFGQGRMVTAQEAVGRGMADHVATLAQVLKRLGATEELRGQGMTGGEAGGAVRLAGYRAQAIAAECGLPLLAFIHNSKVADKEPSWGAVDKTKLPRIAFADKGDPDKKSTWGYPHHWVQNGGNLDDNGVYTTGTLYLHQEGLNAAWSAAMGGRSGEKASQEVIDHLRAHRRALGLEQ